VGERGTILSPELVSEAKRGLLRLIEPFRESCDMIVTIAPGGNQWALLAAEATGLPLTIIRDGTSGWPDEIEASHQNQLYKRRLYFRKEMRGKRVIFVDDVISSSRTLRFVSSNNSTGLVSRFWHRLRSF